MASSWDRTNARQQSAHRSMKRSTRTEELVREPAQRIARHVRNHPRRETPRKPAQPISSPNNSKRVQHTPAIPDLRVGRGAPRLQERFCNVEGSRETRGHTAGDASGHDVRQGRVVAPGIHELLHVFVHGELCGRERHRHGERRRVRHVESGYPFFSEDRARAGDDRAKFGLVHLHSLFYDCGEGGVSGFMMRPGLVPEKNIAPPSNGFMSASLAIVAEAPAKAGTPTGSKVR